MSRGHVVFASIPLYGHFGPLLHQARELSRRGWRVSLASFSEARGAVERLFPEIEFLDLGSTDAPPAEVEAILRRVTDEPDFARGMLLILQGISATWPHFYDAFLEHLRRDPPDLVVADLATTAAMDAAEAAGVPYLVNSADLLPVLPAGLLPYAPRVPAILSGVSMRELRGVQRALQPLRRAASLLVGSLLVGRLQNRSRRSRGLPPVGYHRRLADVTVLVNTAFGLEYPRPLPPNVHLVGPMLSERETLPEELSDWLQDGPPVVLVSLGTIALPSDELVARLAEGLRSDRFRVLWSFRPHAGARLPDDLPPNVRVEPWLPQMAALLSDPALRVFVTHCGTNSVQESLWCGTPMVGIPLIGVQGDMALRIEDAGVGVALRKDRFTPAELRAAIERVLSDDTFRRPIPALRESMERAGGVTRAADLIEAEARRGAPVPRADPPRAWFTLPNGVRVACLSADDARFTTRELWEEGGYLRHGLSLEPGATVIDVGANVGIFALWVLDRCGPDAAVHSFEPVPAVYRALETNLAATGSGRLRALPYGLSDREEEALIRFHPKLTLWSTRDGEMDERRTRALHDAAPGLVDFLVDATGETPPSFPARLLRRLPRSLWVALARRKLRDYGEHAPIPCAFRRLGDYLRETGIERVDLLKVDTEGDELRVLRGIDPEQWGGIRQVAMEVDGVGEESAEEARSFLEGLGYTVVVERQGMAGRAWSELGVRDHQPYALYARREGVAS